ncbi:ABC transporter permease [Devosia sp. Root685]|uniref:carbohydrate ABC transporter permease n=1 Tax=Devosia sp. Root685 TaxID=1736587 RepID=UPI0006F65318|nr:sugar ABC transporter permease [Devosia sp. Root685]KRA99800.1 ABC transporter permease [Devosia sp. Root685]
MLRGPYPAYFVLPALVLYLTFFIVPSIGGIGYSFTDWNSYSTEVNFIGLDNYARIFSPKERYLTYLANTMIFAVVSIALKTVLGLGLAVLLHEGVKRFVNLYRVLIYLPVVLPTLIVALIFKSILNPATGLLNSFLRSVGLDGFALQWLVDPRIALFSIIGVDTWKGVGFITVILLAGLQTIPKEYYEAAKIDGAGAWARFRHVTIPMLMPAIVVVTVLNVLHGLRVFDIVYALTNGGPGYATEVIYTEIFKAFSQGRFGLGTAISSVLFVILAVAGYFVIRLLERKPTR